jgi:uncharacterized membrane protein YqjE
MSTSDVPATSVTDGRAPLRERPTGELVKDLSTQVSTLVRQELELAKVELSAKGREAGIGAGMFGAAGVLALLGLGAVTAAAILALNHAVADWLAAVIVAAVWFVAAATLALIGKQRTQRAGPATPQQTVATLKEDVRYTKERVQAARR